MQASLLLQLAVVLAAAKLASEASSRILRQPPVLGEIAAGMLLGPGLLKCINGTDSVLATLAEVGAVFLLFEVGLTTRPNDLLRMGFPAVWIAVTGVLLSVGLGYGAARLTGVGGGAALFAAAALSATSIGITARVFSDLNALESSAARAVLGAAVADDVIGLVLITVVLSVIAGRTVSVLSVAGIIAKATLFLVCAGAAGILITPGLLRISSTMRSRAALTTAVMVFCLVAAAGALAAGLAAIIGAFAAGLALAQAEQKVHFDRQISAVADFFVPIFFVMMGARLDIAVMNPATAGGRAVLLVGLALALAVTAGKMIACWTTPTGNFNRWTAGVGMMPRGEVTLIAAGLGLRAGVVSASLYGSIMMVVIITTVAAPPLLRHLLHRGYGKGGY